MPNHPNRGPKGPFNPRARLTINTDGDWHRYNYFIPEYCTPLGTVSVGDVSGILVHQRDGLYCMIHADGCAKLDQRKAKAALGISNNAGRTAELTEGRRVNVYLDADSLERASELGNGNVSEGIRIALQRITPSA